MQRISNSSKLIVTVFLLGYLVAIGCDNKNPLSSDKNFVAKKTFSYEVEVVNHARLNLTGIAGTISISGVSGSNSVKITGEKRVESYSQLDADERLQELEVRVQDLANEVLVKTIQPNNTNSRHYIVNYTITLPKNIDVTVNTVNGQVTLNEILGSVHVALINGEINSKVTLPLDGTIDLNIINGKLELDIPQNTSANFAATVGNGTISVSNLDLQNRVETSKSLRGACGDGRGTISLNTTNGDIKVTGF